MIIVPTNITILLPYSPCLHVQANMQMLPRKQRGLRYVTRLRSMSFPVIDVVCHRLRKESLRGTQDPNQRSGQMVRNHHTLVSTLHYHGYVLKLTVPPDASPSTTKGDGSYHGSATTSSNKKGRALVDWS